MIWVDDLVSDIKLQYCPQVKVGRRRWECHGRAEPTNNTLEFHKRAIQKLLIISGLHRFSHFSTNNIRQLGVNYFVVRPNRSIENMR